MTFAKAKKAEVKTVNGVEIMTVRSFGKSGLFGSLNGNGVMVPHSNFIGWVR